MSTTIRPDNLRAALDAKIAAALSQLAELREAEQPRVTPHLNAREIVGRFLLYANGVFPIADTFGKAQAGDLQFNAWHDQWLGKLNDADRLLWKHLHDDRTRQQPGERPELIDVEISVASDPSITSQPSSPGARADVRKRLVRFASQPSRAASAVCDEYLRLAKRFAEDFVLDHSRFLP